MHVHAWVLGGGGACVPSGGGTKRQATSCTLNGRASLFPCQSLLLLLLLKLQLPMMACLLVLLRFLLLPQMTAYLTCCACLPQDAGIEDTEEAPQDAPLDAPLNASQASCAYGAEEVQGMEIDGGAGAKADEKAGMVVNGGVGAEELRGGPGRDEGAAEGTSGEAAEGGLAEQEGGVLPGEKGVVAEQGLKVPSRQALEEEASAMEVVEEEAMEERGSGLGQVRRRGDGGEGASGGQCTCLWVASVRQETRGLQVCVWWPVSIEWPVYLPVGGKPVLRGQRVASVCWVASVH